MSVSLDGTKLAVATLSYVLIYVFEDYKHEKRSIINKIKVSKSPLKLVWPLKHKLFGLLDTGEVFMLHVKTNKQTIIFLDESLPICLSNHYKFKGLAISYYSGSIYSFSFANFEKNEKGFQESSYSNYVKKVAHVYYKPFIVLWAYHNMYLVSGTTLSIGIYEEIKESTNSQNHENLSNFSVLQSFDFNEEIIQDSEDYETELTCAILSNDGKLAAFGSSFKIRLLCYDATKKLWEYRAGVKHGLGSVQNPLTGTLSCMAWSGDSSQLTVATISGAIANFSHYIRRLIYTGKEIEITYVTKGVIIVSQLKSEEGDEGDSRDGTRQKLCISTLCSDEIGDTQFYRGDRILVCETKMSLLVADLCEGIYGEIERGKCIDSQEEFRIKKGTKNPFTIIALKPCYPSTHRLVRYQSTKSSNTEKYRRGVSGNVLLYLIILRVNTKIPSTVCCVLKFGPEPADVRNKATRSLSCMGTLLLPDNVYESEDVSYLTRIIDAKLCSILNEDKVDNICIAYLTNHNELNLAKPHDGLFDKILARLTTERKAIVIGKYAHDDEISAMQIDPSTATHLVLKDRHKRLYQLSVPQSSNIPHNLESTLLAKKVSFFNFASTAHTQILVVECKGERSEESFKFYNDETGSKVALVYNLEPKGPRSILEDTVASQFPKSEMNIKGKVVDLCIDGDRFFLITRSKGKKFQSDLDEFLAYTIQIPKSRSDPQQNNNHRSNISWPFIEGISDGDLDLPLSLAPLLYPSIRANLQNGHFAKAKSLLAKTLDAPAMNLLDRSWTDKNWVQNLFKNSLENGNEGMGMTGLLASESTPGSPEYHKKSVSAEQELQFKMVDNLIHNEIAAFNESCLKLQSSLGNGDGTRGDLVNLLIKNYRSFGLWQEAIQLAAHSANNSTPGPDEYSYDTLCQQYLVWLKETGQYFKAGNFLQKQNRDPESALESYISSQQPNLAVKSLQSNPDITLNNSDMEKLIGALKAKGFYKQAGDLEFKNKHDKEGALDSYVKGHLYPQALHLAKQYFPQRVVELEQTWGDYLISLCGEPCACFNSDNPAQNYDSNGENQMYQRVESRLRTNKTNCQLAINHYIEAGALMKAIKTALDYEEWDKAEEILVEQHECEEMKPYFERLGRHFIRIKNYESAIDMFRRANDSGIIVDVMIENKAWDELKNFFNSLDQQVMGRSSGRARQQSESGAMPFDKPNIKSIISSKIMATLDRLKVNDHQSFAKDEVTYDTVKKLAEISGQIDLVIEVYSLRKDYENLLDVLTRNIATTKGNLDVDFTEVSSKLYGIGLELEKKLKMTGDKMTERTDAANEIELACGFYQLSSRFATTEANGEGWKAAIASYTKHNMWNKALSVIKSFGSATKNADSELRKLAITWARYLGPDAAVLTLKKMDLLDAFFSQPNPNTLDLGDDDDHYYELALKMAPKTLPKPKEEQIRFNYAKHLLRAGKCGMAENEFIRCGKVKEAVEMYCDKDDYESAIRLLSSHLQVQALESGMGASSRLPYTAGAETRQSLNSLTEDVLGKLADFAWKHQTFSTAEPLFIKMKRTDLLLNIYKKGNRWDDALRIARQYLPSQISCVDKELTEYNIKEGKGDPRAVFEKAKEIEANYADDPKRAADMYIKAGLTAVNSDTTLSKECFGHALGLLIKSSASKRGLVTKGYVSDVLEKEITPLLLTGQHYDVLASLYETMLASNCSTHLPKSTILDIFLKASKYGTAKRLTNQMGQGYENYVADYLKQQYTRNQDMEFMKGLAEIDLRATLNYLVSLSKWDDCLALANESHDSAIVKEYTVQFANHLVESGREDTLRRAYNLLMKEFSNGVAVTSIKEVSTFLSLSKTLLIATPLCTLTICKGGSENESLWLQKEPLTILTSVRDALWNIMSCFGGDSTIKLEKNVEKELNDLIWIYHLIAFRTSLAEIVPSQSDNIGKAHGKEVSSRQELLSIKVVEIMAEIGISCLRYSDVLIPAPLAFYIAGTGARDARWIDTAFVFLNLYLDTCEMWQELGNNKGGREENDLNLDFSAIKDCKADIALHVTQLYTLQTKKTLSQYKDSPLDPKVQDEIRDWVLAASLQRDIDKPFVLPINSLTNRFVGCLEGKPNRPPFEPCVITGYPVVSDDKICFSQSGRMANFEDWNFFLELRREKRKNGIEKVYNFIIKWCGEPKFL